MAVLILLELKAGAGHAGDLRDFFKEELKHTRGFDGCNDITVHSNQEDPDNLVIVETWDSREQYEKYLTWRTERGDMEKLGGWVAGAPSIRYFNNLGV